MSTDYSVDKFFQAFQ
jgi:hypothetical protein